MKKVVPVLLLLMSVTASADWLKINGAADSSAGKFIDTKTMRQTGPMNTMRRVWELSNLTNGASNKALSTKAQVEYDCKDRRVRVLEETSFSEHWAQGDNLTLKGLDIKTGDWSAISKGTVSDTIFNRVCPNDN